MLLGNISSDIAKPQLYHSTDTCLLDALFLPRDCHIKLAG